MMQSQNGHKRAALYARVSTREQLDNTSPEAQLKSGRTYCAALGYRLVCEKIEAISGVFVLARSEYNDLLNMAADDEVDVIVVDVPDRLGRGDTIAKCELLAEMNGARIEYASPGRDTSTTEGYIQHSAEQMVSGIERLNIRRRMTNGRRDRARGGRVIASRVCVYGYDTKSERDALGRKTACWMVVNADQARIVQQIFEWCVIDNLSSYAIADRLTAMKAPTPRGHGTDWRRSTIVGILKNETYTGVWHYAKYHAVRRDTPDGVRVKHQLRDRSEWIPVNVPAVISRELFDEAQKRQLERRKRGSKPAKYPYLLRGRIKCARCHGSMTGVPGSYMDGVPLLYYRCRHTWPEYVSDHCAARMGRAEEIEEVVWRFVHDTLLDDGPLFEGIEAQRAEAARARRTIQTTLAALEAQNQKAQGKLDRLLDALIGGDVDKATYQAKKKAIDAELERRALEIQDYRKQLAGYRVVTPEQESELREYRAKLARGLARVDFETKRKYLDWLKIECIYDDRTGEVTIMGLLGEASVLTGTSLSYGQYAIPFSATFSLAEALSGA